MSHKVYLIGVDHQVQHDGGQMSPERKEAMDALTEFLKEQAKKLMVGLLAEEFNEDALRKSNALSPSTVRKVADCLGLPHLFCDPTREERRKRNIQKEDKDKREQFWLSCLEKHPQEERILFVCGAEHVDTFAAKLRGSGFEVESLCQQFGIGLPEIFIVKGSAAMIPELYKKHDLARYPTPEVVDQFIAGFEIKEATMKKCPKCGGAMKLPLATEPLDPQKYTEGGGAKLLCAKCGFKANPSELRSK